MTRAGVARWSTQAWRAEATAWIDAQLAAAGRERTGPVEVTRVRSWAAVLRAPTGAGPVWMKAAGPHTAFEAPLYEVLARVVPEHVLVPLAVDRERAWILLPDAGRSLGEQLEGEALVAPFAAALARYGRLQRALAPHTPSLLDAGVPDMRPATMPARFHEALAAAGPDGPLRARVAAIEGEFRGWCEQLAASPLPPSLDHNDLHPWNVVGDRVYDWGDSVLAHPFAAMLVPLGVLRHLLGCALDDQRLRRARDAYLAGFGDPAELAGTLELACRVGKIARVLTWDRALRGASEVDPRFAAARLETLASVLDPSPLLH